MDVSGDTTYYARHYGSAYTMADHETRAHNIYFTASFMATQKLRLTGTVDYNMSEAAFESVEFDENELRSRLINDQHPSGDLHHFSYNFTPITAYSDIDYEILRLSFGAEYVIGPRVTITADADYADLTDNAGSVYGVQSGSMMVVRGGVRLGL